MTDVVEWPLELKGTDIIGPEEVSASISWFEHLVVWWGDCRRKLRKKDQKEKKKS